MYIKMTVEERIKELENRLVWREVAVKAANIELQEIQQKITEVNNTPWYRKLFFSPFYEDQLIFSEFHAESALEKREAEVASLKKQISRLSKSCDGYVYVNVEE